MSSSSLLKELSKMTTISIDSGDLDIVEKYSNSGYITDATTNPLFISQAGTNGDERYLYMVEEALTYAKNKGCINDGCNAPMEVIDLAIDRLSVNLGSKLCNIVPGKVSTEVDIRLSYDINASVNRALRIISMYKELGINKNRVLIKLAGTWEGIQAASILKKEYNIECNITLIFGFAQAVASAQANAYLVSPFPGRILDWHKKHIDNDMNKSYEPHEDVGVITCKRIYNYLKKYSYDTICMPASWRPSRGSSNDIYAIDEIIALAGIDEMTIPSNLLDILDSSSSSDSSDSSDSDIVLKRQCDVISAASKCTDPDIQLNEKLYKDMFNADRCAVDKLEEGIRAFTEETEKLANIFIERF